MRSFRSQFSWKDAFFGLGGLCLFFIAMLIIIGISFIYSVYPSKAIKQIVWLFLGAIPFVVILLIDYRWLLKHAYWIFWVAMLLLLITAVVGTTRGGSRRWLKIGPLLLQTSEIMKLAIIIVLARLLSRQQRSGRIKDLLSPFFITALPIALIVLQPDLGTSLVFVPIVLVMVFASGVPIMHLVMLILLGVTMGLPVYHIGLHEYQKQRIKMFLFQSEMTQEQKKGSGYHLVQSKIAHGSGGLFGKGMGKGTQNRYGLLPERHTDFIFAVVGEEWGFVGTTMVLLLYLSLYFIMLLIAYTTTVPSMQLIIIGITTLLLTQTVVNTYMTVGLAPITGLPLPFISYGGSALLFNLSAMAIIISITGRRNAIREN